MATINLTGSTNLVVQTSRKIYIDAWTFLELFPPPGTWWLTYNVLLVEGSNMSVRFVDTGSPISLFTIVKDIRRWTLTEMLDPALLLPNISTYQRGGSSVWVFAVSSLLFHFTTSTTRALQTWKFRSALVTSIINGGDAIISLNIFRRLFRLSAAFKQYLTELSIISLIISTTAALQY